MFKTLFLKSLGKRFAQSNKQFSNADHLSASLCAGVLQGTFSVHSAPEKSLTAFILLQSLDSFRLNSPV